MIIFVTTIFPNGSLNALKSIHFLRKSINQALKVKRVGEFEVKTIVFVRNAIPQLIYNLRQVFRISWISILFRKSLRVAKMLQGATAEGPFPHFSR